MRRLLWLTALIPLAVATGCGESRSAKAPEKSSQEAPAQAVAKPAEAQTQEEGMCKEHGVLEALCTKCNPKLAALFQSKGDWCAEHGFPESICPICHPERGGKPAVDVSTDEAPADGTLVILKTMDTAKLAGITTTKAVAGKGKAVVVAPATISYDATRVAQVSARSPGVVKSVLVDVGTQVSAGAALAVIESAAVSGDQSRLSAARSRVQMTEANYRREAELEKKGISAKKDVLAAQQEHREALAELQALQASLRGMGASGGGRYTLKAPVPGVVTQRTVTLDSYVDAQAPLFEIVDTSAMWAELALSEADLGSVKPGMPVVLKVDGLEGHEFKGTISYIAPAVDPQTRTAKARVRLANPEGLLRANMFGQARIEVGASGASVAIPRDAVQRAKTVKLAFVRKAENEFEARRIELASAPVKGELVEIASGLEVGEEVAVVGSYFLKTETLKDAIGAGCCGEE
jgi:cobalt-zinc-cadmium efflux system membrane fusion protein